MADTGCFSQAAYDTNELEATMARAFDDGQEARALSFGSWGDLYITNLMTTAIFCCDLGVYTGLGGPWAASCSGLDRPEIALE